MPILLSRKAPEVIGITASFDTTSGDSVVVITTLAFDG